MQRRLQKSSCKRQGHLRKLLILNLRGVELLHTPELQPMRQVRVTCNAMIIFTYELRHLRLRSSRTRAAMSGAWVISVTIAIIFAPCCLSSGI